MDKDIIDNILSKRPSIAEGAQYILNRYPNKISLDLFLDEFLNETQNRYFETLLKLTDKDILYYIKYLNERKEMFELPLITISQQEYEKVMYFIRNVDDYKVISNCYGFGEEPKANFMQVIQLDYIVLEHFGIVDFLFPLSVSSELRQVDFLFSILEKFDLSFINKRVLQQPQQSQTLKQNYQAKHYALTYILDCYANGKRPPIGEKTALEKIGNELTDGKINGNTFYKNFSMVIGKDLNSKADLNEIDTNWHNITLELSENPENLKNYLKQKKL